MSRKTLTIITIVLFIVAIIVGIFTFANSSALQEKGSITLPDGTTGAGYINTYLLNPLYYWTLVLLIITVAVLFLLPLPAIIKNPRSLRRTLFVIVGVVVAFGIVFLLSKGSPDGETIMSVLKPAQQDIYKDNFLVANMNIIACEIALGLAAIVILWSAVKEFVKK
jgi:hypothetical protein